MLDAGNELAAKTESFLERNAKVLGIVFGALVVGALGYFAYLKYIVEPKNQEAFSNYYKAEKAALQDSLDLALNGVPGSYEGFEVLSDEYSGTDAGNLATYQAGIVLYNQGKFKEALEKFENFSTKDDALEAQRLGMMGNALSQAKNYEDALDYYKKAAAESELEPLQTLYLTKAGILAMELKKDDVALELFTQLEEAYPNSNNGDTKKYIAMLSQK